MDFLNLCLIVKDENKYLQEWVDYHTLIGVERFIVYDNGSNISVRETLVEDIARGRVIVIDFPGKKAQMTSYAHCLHFYGKHAQWIGFIDIDEFIVPKTTTDLREFLEDYEAFGAIAIHWVIFGASGHKKEPQGPQYKNFIKETENDFPPNHYVKSIVQPRYTVYPMGVHYFHHFPKHPVVNENFLPISGFDTPRSAKKIQLNHYFCRSEEEFRRKLKRGDAIYGEITSKDMNFFYKYDQAACIENRHILDLIAKLVPGGKIDGVHSTVASYPVTISSHPEKTPSPIENFNRFETEILSKEMKLAIEQKDSLLLHLIIIAATDRFGNKIRQHQWFIHGLLKLIEICINNKDYKLARILLMGEGKNAQVPPNPQAYFFLGQTLLMLGDTKGVEDALLMGLSLDPKHTGILDLLSVFYFNQERYPEAIGLFHRITQIDSSFADAWAFLSLAAWQLNAMNTFTHAYLQVCELAPDHPLLPELRKKALHSIL